ncbi:RNA 3'-terminal phosphate cyclase [Candidatus Vecturithrix granuli]|uniref:RNA 3'-terminal phosphate cyclase n=1 Tax=Vecturithrix granuli TaxID=1499967 RepID=A0A081C794_VECG1|nr:RNA 3'-terminal phosphate cyclase [Candidatus Vecturithrix granuli]
MVVIDGAFGEGGGQILRTSLALSLVTCKPFQIERIRANRKKPGLGKQHLTAVNAAAQVGSAHVQGNSLGSMELTFAPQQIIPGRYHFVVGTAGSSTLVLQTILPALLTVPTRSELILEGGTHNPLAPSFDFLEKTFLPILCRMGVNITVSLERPGFYPAGGGKFSALIEPTNQLSRLDLFERGIIKKCSATALLSKLPQHIGERELNILERELGWPARNLTIEEVQNPYGPGNALIAKVECEHITTVFTGFGERGVRAETVAHKLAEEIREYLDADVPVDRHLADQLILPMALAGGGGFRTIAPTTHTLTNIEVLKQFLAIDVSLAQLNPAVWEVTIKNP